MGFYANKRACRMRVVSLLLLLLTTFAAPAAATDCPITVPLFGYSGDLGDLVGGYCNWDGLHTPGLITESFYWTPTPQNIITRAVFQNAGVIEATAALKSIDLSDVDGNGIAFYTPSMAGWKVWLMPPDTNDWSLSVPARIVDVDTRVETDYHVFWMRSGLELNYRLAQEWGVPDYVQPNGDRYPMIRVCVTNDHPEIICAGEPVELRQWYIDNARFVGGLSRVEAAARSAGR